MMAFSILILSILTFTSIYTPCFSQNNKTPVFISGKEGHHNYRIPAIINLPNKHLLAFCEGRVNGSADFGDINIVMKRSVDGGNTWSALITLVDFDTLQAGNPAPVVDLTDPNYPNGRIFLFYNTGNNHENEIRKGNGIREVWFITSTDNGTNWSAPVNITTQTHKPFAPKINSQYNFSEDWRSYANTPGHAMQFSSGKYKGRIYVAANHSSGIPQVDYSDYRSHGFFTDDHGKTFTLSENVDIPGSNEAMAAELKNDMLIMNMRNQRGDKKCRIVALSKNGGLHWDTVFFDDQLPDPICQASILNIKKRKNLLAFSNASHITQRNNLTIKISRNGGASWYKSFLIESITDNKGVDFTAYSDLVVLDRKNLGILYERNNYKEIVFTSLLWR